jgi:hypothetical protein
LSRSTRSRTAASGAVAGIAGRAASAAAPAGTRRVLRDVVDELPLVIFRAFIHDLDAFLLLLARHAGNARPNDLLLRLLLLLLLRLYTNVRLHGVGATACASRRLRYSAHAHPSAETTTGRSRARQNLIDEIGGAARRAAGNRSTAGAARLARLHGDPARHRGGQPGIDLSGSV